MDFPSINSPDRGEPDKRARDAEPRGFLRPWHLVLVMLVAVFGPCTAVQAPREVGRWKLAQAIKLREAGEKEEAYARLDEALEWYPKSMEMRLLRAEWYLEDGRREEAIAEADRLLEEGETSLRVLTAHSTFMQNAGEFAKAVDDWKEIVRQSEVSGRPTKATAMNGLAYAQSLANAELDEALDHVNVALEAEPENPAYLDTRGFIYYQQSRAKSGEEATELLNKGLADMDPAVKGMDRVVAQLRGSADAALPEKAKRAKRSGPKTLQELESNEETLVRGSAVMHYHRALILEALGRQKEADAERAVARRLIGREPDETLF